MGPNPVAGILVRRGKFGHRDTQGECHVTRGRYWNDVPTRQRMPRIARNHQKLGSGRERFFPRALRERMALLIP